MIFVVVVFVSVLFSFTAYAIRIFVLIVAFIRALRAPASGQIASSQMTAKENNQSVRSVEPKTDSESQSEVYNSKVESII